MTRMRIDRSAASRVFIVLFAAALVAGVIVAIALAASTQRATRAEAEQRTIAISRTLSASPVVIEALEQPEGSAASAQLQPYTQRVLESVDLDFVTVMTPQGTRITHPDEAQIGGTYLGTIPTTATALTEEFEGTLGLSIRTITPVIDDAGRVAGWVSAGVTIESIAESFAQRVPTALGLAALIIAAGSFGAYLARRFTRRIAGDLPAGTVRDAVASFESVRTLGEALRAQTHEHGNRMHTAIALLELGRTQEAIEILAETSAQSQSLVDQVTAQRDGDPTIGALLLGKASQAKERGITWSAQIDPGAPATGLSAVDSVAVIGNLIDNAMDAAAEASERWVRITVDRQDPAALRIEVSDSGSGVPRDLRERVFAHGFSTKPTGLDGRGVGLALVRSVVSEAGGSVTLTDDPTTFTVVLPITDGSSQ